MPPTRSQGRPSIRVQLQQFRWRRVLTHFECQHEEAYILFGVATAAYQVEGAVENEGKAPSMWDWANKTPGAIVDNTTGDITDLQYFLYKEDVARVAALGINAH
ncbi:hypothetical protein D9758_013573 [Tetrapyrgos nigripes]|uniref:Uncharacterized protein n=1 Tax=Tetrapyrgos nigripes TaxID=182062 RepID=A0A8H5CEU5_9AGAR|nr:hypothetical protein D9758_013573 [Tetrapyrgos nigripes]